MCILIPVSLVTKLRLHTLRVQSQSSLVRVRFGIPTQTNIRVYTLKDYAMLAFTIPVFCQLPKPMPLFDKVYQNIMPCLLS